MQESYNNKPTLNELVNQVKNRWFDADFRYMNPLEQTKHIIYKYTHIHPELRPFMILHEYAYATKYGDSIENRTSSIWNRQDINKMLKKSQSDALGNNISVEYFQVIYKNTQTWKTNRTQEKQNLIKKPPRPSWPLTGPVDFTI